MFNFCPIKANDQRTEYIYIKPKTIETQSHTDTIISMQL